MHTSLPSATASVLLAFLLLGCQSTQPVTDIPAQPLPDPGPLPAWTKTTGIHVGDKDARLVKIEMMIIELTYDVGEEGIPATRYEKRITESERQDHTQALKRELIVMVTPTIVDSTDHSFFRQIEGAAVAQN